MNRSEQSSSVPTGSVYDALVVGGGPAGATIAALLGERGHRVLVLEKDHHPRFHIGESLLPLNLPLFDRLGIRSEVERSAIRKYGVEFVSRYHGKSVTYEFARALDKRFPYSFQVRRSVFDHLLVQNAVAKGAELIEGMRASFVEFGDNKRVRVTARNESGIERCWETRFLVDASGRDTFLAGQLGGKDRNPRNNTAAIFGHFTGARRLPGKAEGNISIVWFDHGWFWFIPLIDGTTSVGAVCSGEFIKARETADLTSFFMGLVAEAPEIADRLKDAQLIGPATATGNYSYSTRQTSGRERNYIVIGDACAFIDPVFSTGVYLAMSTAFFGAEAVDACLRQPEGTERVLRHYDRQTHRAISAFTWFIYRIREPAMRNLFMSPRNWFRIEETVLSLLAGDIFGTRSLQLRLTVFKLIYYITKLAHLRHRFLSGRRERSGPADAAA